MLTKDSIKRIAQSVDEDITEEKSDYQELYESDEWDEYVFKHVDNIEKSVQYAMEKTIDDYISRVFPLTKDKYQQMFIDEILDYVNTKYDLHG